MNLAHGNRHKRIEDSIVFSNICQQGLLLEAWQRVWRNGGAAGGDGISVEAFASEVHRRLAYLSDDLSSGRYEPGPIRLTQIPKNDGGLRPLAIPSVRDRVAQTAVMMELAPRLDKEFEDSSFAYRAGRSVQQAVRRVGALQREGFFHVVDADIERFFEEIPHELLLERLSRSMTEGPLSELIALWLEHGSANGKGVPQGSPLSPLLSNLYLDSLDEAFAGEGARIVRYADDFVILCRSEEGADGALARTRKLLARSGLKLNEDKTRITSFDQGFRFLGQIFVRSFAFPDPDGEFTLSEKLLKEVAEADRAAEALALRHKSREETQRHAGLDPGQRILYLTQPGRRLDGIPEGFRVQEKEGRLGAAVRSGRDGHGEEWRDILLLKGNQVDRIEIGSSANLTREAIFECLATETPLAFVNGHGETLGWLSPAMRPRAGRQMAQAAAAIDPEARLVLAKAFVEGRLRNQRAMLRRLNRDRKEPEIARALAQLNYTIRKVEHADTLNRLRGIEGEGGKLYWRSLSRCMKPGFSFERRERPARDFPVNILLNAAASMLIRDCTVALHRAGLHPGFGMLHESGDYRDAAAYDLAEEFRVALAEGPVVAAVNRGAVSTEMFTRQDDGSYRAGRSAMAALIRAREQAASRVFRDPVKGHRTTWRALISDQALRLAAHLEGDQSYVPVVMDY